MIRKEGSVDSVTNNKLFNKKDIFSNFEYINIWLEVRTLIAYLTYLVIIGCTIR